MGNYYEGQLIFAFKQEYHQLVIDDMIKIEKLDYRYKDYKEYQSKFEQLLESNHDDFFLNGINVYRNSYGQLRNIRTCQYGFLEDENDEDSFVSYDIVDLVHDYNATDPGDPEYGTTDSIFEDYPELPKQLDLVNYISFNKAFLSKYSEEFTNDSKLQLFIIINVCDKNYNGDKDLEKLIELWSPYLDEDYYIKYTGDLFIGSVYDEDRTFLKDYYVNNNHHDNHWEFCGEWCEYYNSNVRCKDQRCKSAYEIGQKSIK